MEIEKLNELDSFELLQRIGEHLRKNNMEHLIDKVFDIEDQDEEIARLNERIEELEQDKSELEEDHVVLSAKIDESISKIKLWMTDQEGIVNDLLDTLE